MLSDEQLKNIIESNLPYLKNILPENSDWIAVSGVMEDVIKEALEEETRWFYPERGEIPDREHEEILFIYKHRKLIEHGYFYLGHFFKYAFSDTASPPSAVKCWRYAPELPEGV